MDHFSTMRNPGIAQLQCAAKIELTLAEARLLQRAFQDKANVKIEQQFAGYSGAAIYLVTCDGQAPVVVKMDHPYHICQEYAAYQQFVKRYLALMAARIEQEPFIDEQCQLGLLIYTFIGVDPAQRAGSLLDYYQERGGKATGDLLHLIFDYGRCWWLYHQPQRIFAHEAYGLLLPADLHLRVSAGPVPATLVLCAHAIHLPTLRRLQPGQAVRLEGFQVIKARPNALTLSVPPPPGQRPAPPYLRLTGQLDQVYQPGDILASQVAVVEATQVMCLAAYATQCLPNLKPTQPAFALEGRQYRNPLVALTDLLDTPYDTNISIIHGDLNLQNIMVLANREQQTRFAWLIDFAQTRRGPTLLDLQRLEVQIITKLLPTAVKPGHLVMLLEALHTRLPCVRAPVATLQEPYTVLVALRRLMTKYLIDGDKWGEYYRGLALTCLGALKFEELSDAARQRAVLVAAIVLDLADKPLAGAPQPRPWRQRVGPAVAAVLLLLLALLSAASNPLSTVPAEKTPADLTPTVSYTATPSLAIETYKNVATSHCLANLSGTTVQSKWRQSWCGDNEEAWRVYDGGVSAGGYRVRFFQNVATDLCLVSNDQGEVYTHSCDWGDYQKWEIRRPTLDPYIIIFRSRQSGLCLHSDPTGRVYTQTCNGLDEQRWH